MNIGVTHIIMSAKFWKICVTSLYILCLVHSAEQIFQSCDKWEEERGMDEGGRCC